MGDYWYLWALIIILIPITIAVCFKAAKASQKSREEKRKYIAEMDRLKALKDEFSSLTKEEIENNNSDNLLSGMALITELKLKKSDDANCDFLLLSDEVKNVYVLDSILEECENGVSSFYKNNTSPVIEIAASSLKAIGLDEMSALFKEAFSMFDENNESVSIDFERLKKIDEQFLELNPAEKIKTAAALYIKRNAAEFCNK